ncbi:MAG: hypothetical protein J0H00_07995 [Burkholderiales bacterium]|nr:hypothetical protein [Burkholderiales bacterium]OJX08200.1 MAG: hypothetical protein BGO72_01545 [Burkholderiales bacterium 70-64]
MNEQEKICARVAEAARALLGEEAQANVRYDSQKEVWQLWVGTRVEDEKFSLLTLAEAWGVSNA